jgi:hypothetical protein
MVLLLTTVMNEPLERRAQNIKMTSPVLHMHPTPEEDTLLHSCVKYIRVLCVCLV